MGTDFISRNEALNCSLKLEINGRMNAKRIVEEAIQVYSDYISKIPAADVVEVIRCRDCKYFDFRYGECKHFDSFGLENPYEDEYCSRAERKENET